MRADDIGPLEQAWICQGWRIVERDDFAWPKVFEPSGGRVAVLVMPATWARCAEGREAAAGYGIAAAFAGRYGRVMLQRGIRCWPELSAQLADRDRGIAAD